MHKRKNTPFQFLPGPRSFTFGCCLPLWSVVFEVRLQNHLEAHAHRQRDNEHSASKRIETIVAHTSEPRTSPPSPAQRRGMNTFDTIPFRIMMTLARFDSLRFRLGLVFTFAFGLALWGGTLSSAQAQSVTPSKENVVSFTKEWNGKRDSNGRPKVSDSILERMEEVTLEQAWDVLREHGYNNQVAGFGAEWKRIHPNQPIVGRALTAQYMPSRPAFKERTEAHGRQNGFEGPSNTWPIQMLQQGDVYVADGFGKIKDGTLIGDRLGTDIYANSSNGVIFNGSLRDLSGLREIEGFNAFVRGWHPSVIQDMMLTGINVPIRIGETTVFPGDIVLATREGVIFIPPQFAREVVRDAEITLLTDLFAKQRTREGTYTSGQMDTAWTDAIKSDFYTWLEQNKNDLPVPPKRIEEIIDTKPL